jgi:hypothetical protein
VAARGHKTGWPGYDRAYTQVLPERFHLPARALGYHPVMDYRAGQPGIQANSQGALLAEGSWYCPALPGPLITATTRLRDHAITRDLYDQQITARGPCQLKHKDGPDTGAARSRSDSQFEPTRSLTQGPAPVGAAPRGPGARASGSEVDVWRVHRGTGVRIGSRAGRGRQSGMVAT